jgi:hypothetical protein
MRITILYSHNPALDTIHMKEGRWKGMNETYMLFSSTKEELGLHIRYNQS